MKYFFVFALFLTLFSFATAETPQCQYTIETPYEASVLNLYDTETNELIATKNLTKNKFEESPKIPVRFTDFSASGTSVGYNVSNDYSKPITVRLVCDYYSTPPSGRQRNSIDMNREIPSLGSVLLGWSRSGRDIPTLIEETIELSFVGNDYTYTKLETETRTTSSCTFCGSAQCLDDGATCSTDQECGSGFCVEETCSDTETCYNNDCQCSENEVQCGDNTQCVVKKSVEIGSKPICSFEECATKYIDAETGLCAKSPEQKTQEENLMLILLAVILVGIGGAIGYFLYQRKIRPKPYLNSFVNLLVWKNPRMSGYECFYNKDEKNPYSDKPIHRWLWNRKYFPSDPIDPVKGEQIHHVDGDKYNHSKNNLVKLTKEQHKAVHKYAINNRESGIKALQNAGIKLPAHVKK